MCDGGTTIEQTTVSNLPPSSTCGAISNINRLLRADRFYLQLMWCFCREGQILKGNPSRQISGDRAHRIDDANTQQLAM